MIERPYYLDRLKRLRGTGLAKVLTGMRRAGKSGVLRLLETHLLEEGVGPDDILLVNLEYVEHAPLREAGALLDYVHAHARPGRTTFVLVDEAQEASGIGRVAHQLLEEGTYDLYLTGSHSHLVEDELADVMSGRYVEIPVFPLSFAEYHAAHAGLATGTTDAQLFQRYLSNGGLPHTLSLEHDPFALRDYLDGVYHTVVRRDVASGLGHEDPLLVDAISSSLMGGLGSPTSAHGIANALTSSGRSCSDDTVTVYLGALSGAYAFHRMRRLDLRSNLQLKTQERYFASDLGLRTIMLGGNAAPLGGLIQNVVYLELRRRYPVVYGGKHYARQICFVAQGQEGRAYFQVAPSVLDPAELERQLAPLRAERDNYPKTLLTLDEVGVGSHDGILQRNLVEWLLS
jgi:predicted AAA+ superfamily ATPase